MLIGEYVNSRGITTVARIPSPAMVKEQKTFAYRRPHSSSCYPLFPHGLPIYFSLSFLDNRINNGKNTLTLEFIFNLGFDHIPLEFISHPVLGEIPVAMSVVCMQDKCSLYMMQML